MTTHIEQICKAFGQHQALRDVDLTVESGEFVSILGPSGCGKTTLLRILAGFETPTDGRIRIDNRVVSDSHRVVPTERRNLGMVFQSFALWPHLSVADHVRFPLHYQRKMSSADREARVAEVLRIAGLAQLGSRMPHELSGGQRQRVALARAIAAEPSLLLMDEPLSSLDAALREEMRREIQNIHHATGASIVYVTHDQSEALAMSDRVVVMLDGRIEQVGTAEDVYSNPQTSFVATFVGKANLVRGQWDGDAFRPDAGGGRVVWEGSGIAECFRQQGTFPVRPDQLVLAELTADGGRALRGTVRNALFQGRDIQYVVAVEGDEWLVQTTSMATVGATVQLSMVPAQRLTRAQPVAQ